MNFDKIIPSFYTLSLIYDENNTEAKTLFALYAERILVNILQYVYISIEKETRHEDMIRMSTDKRKKIKKRFAMGSGNQVQEVRRSYLLFQHYKWKNVAYGGPAWAKICRAWLDAQLMVGKTHEVPKEDYFRKIDLMIQLSHNTGNVLTKVFFNPQAWLDKKYEEPNPQWVVNQSHGELKVIARRLVKERFGKTFQDIQEEGPFLHFKD